MILQFPHDRVTVLIMYGNIHDIIAQHKLISMDDLVRIVHLFRPACPSEWIGRIIRLCPATFRCERGFVWLNHHCTKCPETCGVCRRASDELQVLVVNAKSL